MARRAPLIALLLVAALGAPTAAEDEEDGAGPPQKAPPTAAELDARLDQVKLTVDWNGASALDGLNEVQQKTGLRFAFDRALADFAEKRKVTFDGYSVTAREALKVLARAASFTFEPDPVEGVYRLRMDPAGPARSALEEKKVSISWKDTPVARAIPDIEKKTGLRIEVHETMKARLKARKITWDADDVTAREALEALYQYPPPSVAGRLDPRPGMKVAIVYVGPPETKADVEFALEDRRVSPRFVKAKVAEFAAFVGEKGGFRCEVDPKVVLVPGVEANCSGDDMTLRAALDQMTKAAGISWRIEGVKVVLRVAAK